MDRMDHNNSIDEPVIDKEATVTKMTHPTITVHKAAEGYNFISVRDLINLGIYTRLLVGVVVPVLSGRSD